MSSKTITDLREHLFAVIEGVRNNTITIEQAKTISDLSQVIVNTAKVEVDFVRATERTGSHFLGGDDAPALPKGILSITRHTLKDD